MRRRLRAARTRRKCRYWKAHSMHLDVNSAAETPPGRACASTRCSSIGSPSTRSGLGHFYSINGDLHVRISRAGSCRRIRGDHEERSHRLPRVRHHPPAPRRAGQPWPRRSTTLGGRAILASARRGTRSSTTPTGSTSERRRKRSTRFAEAAKIIRSSSTESASRSRQVLRAGQCRGFLARAAGCRSASRS